MFFSALSFLNLFECSKLKPFHYANKIQLKMCTESMHFIIVLLTKGQAGKFPEFWEEYFEIVIERTERHG